MEELKNELTNKQKRFCEEYVIDWNSTRAAIAAGYSEKTAYSIGSENLKKPEIQIYIEEIQKNLSKLSGVTALRNIIELSKIAYSNVSDFKKSWSEATDWNDLTEWQKAAISEINTEITNNTTKTKIKLHDKLKAIEVLNKMLDFNAAEKQEIKTDINIPAFKWLDE